MAWLDVSIDAMGVREVERSFEIAAELTEDLSEPLGEVMEALLDSVARQFDTEGAAAQGARWAPLSDAYGKWKAEHYPGFPILVRDGGMKRAMLSYETAVHVGPEEAVYEPVSDIAGYHQSGETWIGHAWNHPQAQIFHLPQRKMVDLSEDWKHEAVDRTFVRWVNRMLKEAQLVRA